MTADEFIEVWRRGEPTVLCHSSGSTGTPKPIYLTRHDMVMSALATNLFSD